MTALVLAAIAVALSIGFGIVSVRRKRAAERRREGWLRQRESDEAAWNRMLNEREARDRVA